MFDESLRWKVISHPNFLISFWSLCLQLYICQWFIFSFLQGWLENKAFSFRNNYRHWHNVCPLNHFSWGRKDDSLMAQNLDNRLYPPHTFAWQCSTTHNNQDKRDKRFIGVNNLTTSSIFARFSDCRITCFRTYKKRTSMWKPQ